VVVLQQVAQCVCSVQQIQNGVAARLPALLRAGIGP